MKRNIVLSSVILLISVLLLTFFACINANENGTENGDVETERKAISISIDKSTIPDNAYAGEVKLTQIIIIVNYNNGDIERVNLNREHISVKSVNLLNSPGTQVIEVIYEDCTCSFNIYLLDPSKVSYVLTVYGGVPIYVDGKKVAYECENGRFEASFNKGTEIIIDWIEEEGKVFGHWKSNGIPVDNQRQTAITMNKDHVYTAVSEDNLHTVTFVTNIMSDGAAVNIAPIKAKQIESPSDIVDEMSLEGYVFVGWTTTFVTYEDSLKGEKNEGFVSEYPYVIAQDVTFYALWTPIGFSYAPITIEYAGNHIDGQQIVDYTGNLTELTIPSVCANGTIIAISKDAFAHENAKLLTTVKIPSSIKRIEAGAFRNCSSLQSFSVDASSYDFSSEQGVLYKNDKSILLAYPSGRITPEYSVESTVIEISAYAFYNAVVGGIVVPSQVSEIGDYAFYSHQIDHIDFTALKAAKIEQALRREKNIFSEKYIDGLVVDPTDEAAYIGLLPNIADKIFTMKSSVNSVYMDEASTYIFRLITGTYFDNKNRTAEIIGVARNVSELNVPQTLNGQNNDFTVSSIAPYAFKDCIKLESLILPTGLERVSDNAFDDTPWAAGLSGLEKNADSIIFNNTIYKYLGNSSVYVLDESIVRIAEGAFAANKTLTAVDITNNVVLTRIDAFAFAECTNLKSFAAGSNGTTLLIKSNLQKIAPYAFKGTALQSIETQNSAYGDGGLLHTVGDYAFSDTSYMERVNFAMNSLTDLSTTAFFNCYALKSLNIAENDIYLSVDGILYKKLSTDNYSLFHYPAGRMTGVFNPSRPKSDTFLNVVSLGEYSLYYSDIGALELEDSVIADNSKSMCLPSIAYVRFLSDSTLHNSSYRTVFGNTGAQNFVFEPNLSFATVASFFGQDNDLIARLTTYTVPCDFYIVDDILYALGDDLTIVGALRSSEAEKITVPETLELDGSYYNKKTVGQYAFYGYNLKSLTVSGISRFDAGALSGAFALELLEILDEEADSVPIIYNDSLGNRFNRDLMIKVNCNPAETDSYWDKWRGIIDTFIYYDEKGDEYEASENLIYKDAFIVLTYQDDNNIRYTSSIQRGTVNQSDLDAVNQKIPGYSVGGWFIVGDEENKFNEICDGYIIKRNLVLECEWVADKYELVFAVPPTIRLNFEAEFLNNDGEWDYYKAFVVFGSDYDFSVINNQANATDFKGWMLGDSLLSEYGTWGTVLDSQTVLYPKTSKREYSVVYDMSDENISVEERSKTVYYDEFFNLSVPTKNGYIFVAWETEDGVILTDKNGASLTEWRISTADTVKVYALWREKEIPVTLMLNEGDLYGEFTIKFASGDYVVPLNADEIPIVLQQDYMDKVRFFAGWKDENGKVYTDAYGKSLVQWDKYNDAVLYAIWPQFIDNKEQLTRVISEDETASIVLRCDIVLTDTLAESYAGVFNGDGHRIKINSTVDSVNTGCGLFKQNNGTIKNIDFSLTLTGNMITASHDIYIGGLCGINNGTIENVTVSLDVDLIIDSVVADVFVGGITGQNNGMIEDIGVVVNAYSVSIGEISGRAYLGSLAGANTGSVIFNDDGVGMKISNFSVTVGNKRFGGEYITMGSLIGSNVLGNKIGKVSGSVRMTAKSTVDPYDAYINSTDEALNIERDGRWDTEYTRFYYYGTDTVLQATDNYSSSTVYYTVKNVTTDYFADKLHCFGHGREGDDSGLTFSVAME